jgi:hypothetical protein
MDMWSLVFWKRLGENAIHASSGAMIGIVGAEGFHLLSGGSWKSALVAAGTGALLSALMTLSSQQVSNAPLGSFVPPKGE